MRKLSTGLPVKQAGFTLVELVIVIVIIGILAAIALPMFSDVAADAGRAANSATLGSVKSAWSAAYAIKKGTPTYAEVATQAPACATTGTTFTCPVKWLSTASAGGTLTINALSLDSPAAWACATSADCS